MRTNLIITIFIIILLCFFIYKITIPTFLNKNKLKKLLKDREYLSKFMKKDLEVRNVKSIDEYIENNIEKSISYFTIKEKIRLIKLTNYINLIILRTKNKSYFDSKKFNKIPWKFGIVKNKLYEQGLPHTRNDIIVLCKNLLDNSSNNSLIGTLIHEKVHIYQKKYPLDTQKFISDKGFIKKRKRDSSIRANPDIDDYVYSDNHGNEYKAVYTNNAKKITDINYNIGNNQKYEHPYENMAIELENYLNIKS